MRWSGCAIQPPIPCSPGAIPSSLPPFLVFTDSVPRKNTWIAWCSCGWGTALTATNCYECSSGCNMPATTLIFRGAPSACAGTRWRSFRCTKSWRFALSFSATRSIRSPRSTRSPETLSATPTPRIFSLPRTTWLARSAWNAPLNQSRRSWRSAWRSSARRTSFWRRSAWKCAPPTTLK